MANRITIPTGKRFILNSGKRLFMDILADFSPSPVPFISPSPSLIPFISPSPSPIISLAEFTIVTSDTPEDFKVQIDGAVNLVVDWGDGSGEETLNGSALRTHAYATADTYTMTVVSGTATRIAFGSAGTTPLLLTAVNSVISADIGLTSAAYFFAGCTNCVTWAPAFFDAASGAITNMLRMFDNNTPFNEVVSGWNTALVTNMFVAFRGTSFNRPVSNFDTGKVITMSFMFSATPFDQDISGFDVSALTQALNMLQGSSFSQTNLDKVYSLTTGWPSQALQDNVPFHAGSATYDDESSDIADGRALLVAATPGGYGWTIIDGGPD